MVKLNEKSALPMPPARATHAPVGNSLGKREYLQKYLEVISVSGEVMPSEATKAVYDVLVARVELNSKVSWALAILTREGLWADAMRIAVKYGGVSQAAISRSAKVMRSTVARWYNSEVEPQRDIQKKYGALICNSILKESIELNELIMKGYAGNRRSLSLTDAVLSSQNRVNLSEVANKQSELSNVSILEDHHDA